MNEYPPQPQHPYDAPRAYEPPGAPLPPAGYAYAPHQSPTRRSPTLLILSGVVVAIVVIALLVLLVIHPNGNSGLGGTWYGAGTTGSVGTAAETFPLETYLTLRQNGSTVTGSGELCSVGSSAIPFSITGTLDGASLAMTWTLADASQGGVQGNTERVTGQFTNNALALRSTDASGYYTATLKRGSHAAFTNACESVTV